MHPMFVTLFIETDADELLAAEEARRRSARRSRRNRPAVALKAVARGRSRRAGTGRLVPSSQNPSASMRRFAR
jgi:hypothetical protein